MLSRNDPCWCGSGQKWKKCHYPKLPENLERARHYLTTYGIILKTPRQIEKIRHVCQITARILDALCKAALRGVTTQELDDYSRELHKKEGVIPAPLGYGDPPYPKTICTSLNEVICHGIPDKRPLQDGDIMNIDVSCILDGFYGDCSRMITVGDISKDSANVVQTSLDCLNLAIDVCRVGNKVSDIAEAIENRAAKTHCSVVNQFVGHGVGVAFHEPPDIPHHRNKSHIPFAPGMIFTIEPMINAGVREGVIDVKDGWTARTKDGKPSAQWEHTLLITEGAPEILTLI